MNIIFETVMVIAECVSIAASVLTALDNGYVLSAQASLEWQLCFMISMVLCQVLKNIYILDMFQLIF